MSKLELFSLLLLVGVCGLALAEDSKRAEKLFPVFQIVRFNNEVCAGTEGRNGTCYTTDECKTRGGTGAGQCAGGYGVCCLFTKGCGTTTRENNTYFTVNGATAGNCNLEVCKCGSNICQLRLDFQTFQITGPNTLSDNIGSAFGNNLITQGALGRAVTNNGQCLTDSFSVTNPGGSAPPVICGINTNEHMYVDASEACNDLRFALGANAMGATIPTRNWNIKVTQYACDYDNLAPKGCTQYFFGSNTGTVRSYNFQPGVTSGNIEHLANQNQVICVRRERNNCRICWAQVAETDFAISGTDDAVNANLVGKNNPKTCCGYGSGASEGKNVDGFDCVEIPGAIKKTNNNGPLLVSRFCGRRLISNDANAAATKTSTTICSTDIPFQIRFLSDSYENQREDGATNGDRGFQLGYNQVQC